MFSFIQWKSGDDTGSSTCSLSYNGRVETIQGRPRVLFHTMEEWRRYRVVHVFSFIQWKSGDDTGLVDSLSVILIEYNSVALQTISGSLLSYLEVRFSWPSNNRFLTP